MPRRKLVLCALLMSDGKRGKRGESDDDGGLIQH
jgi:hypothetical protein